MKLKIFLVLYLSFFSLAFSQTERFKWEKADIVYRLEQAPSKSAHTLDSSNQSNFLLKSVTQIYWFLISDLDGDNCPFHPSCSSFLLDAVNETNIFQGTMMFLDRFTRDASFIGRYNRYPKHFSGKLYDPAVFYDLKSHDYIPVRTTINQ